MVSAAQATAAARQDVGPQMQDPVAALHMQQLADPDVNKPAAPWAVADLGPATAAFRFRSKPGFRKLRFTFLVPPETADEEYEARLKKAYNRIWKDKQKEFQAEQRLQARYGERAVEFRSIPGKFECEFSHDDPELAAWLRKRPEFGVAFYEEMAPMTVTLPTGRVINVVPQSDADRQALSAATG